MSSKKEKSSPPKNHQYSETWIPEKGKLLIKFGSISVSWDLLDSILQNLMKHDRPFGKFPSPKSFILRVLKSKLSSLLKSFRTVHFMRKYFCACSNSKANPIHTPRTFDDSTFFNITQIYKLPSRDINDQSDLICCLIRIFPPPACN